MQRHASRHDGVEAQVESNTDMRDEALIRRIAGGDEEAFSRFFRRWAPRLGAFILRSTRQPDVTDDLVQEVFVRILRAAPRYESRGQASAWVLRIAANLTYSHWRTQKRSRVDATGLDRLIHRTPEPSHRAPDHSHERAQFRHDLEAALEALPPNQRMAFLLKTSQGLTYAEIGEVLRCPEGTVKSRFHHAVLKLRATLREWSGGFGPENDSGPGRGRRVGPRRHVEEQEP